MVGSHTAEYYAKKGNEIIVLDNLMRSKLFGYDKKSVEHNWNPTISTIEGMKKIIRWVKENKRIFN